MVSLWTILANSTFEAKTAVTTFWATLRKIGHFFIPDILPGRVSLENKAAALKLKLYPGHLGREYLKNKYNYILRPTPDCT